MTTYKFTSKERQRIRLWLEKRPNADTLQKQWPFEREDGSVLPLTRCTQYIPGGKWKVRIAYVESDGYPIASSGPIASHIDAKGKPQNKAQLVPKAYAWDDHEVHMAVQKEVAAHIKKQINTPNPIWAMLNEPEPSPYLPEWECNYCGDDGCDACEDGAP